MASTTDIPKVSVPLTVRQISKLLNLAALEMGRPEPYNDPVWTAIHAALLSALTDDTPADEDGQPSVDTSMLR
jgi:hypothetical protein